MERLVELVTIDLGSNRLTSLEACRALTKLEELWIGDNAIQTADDLEPLAKLPNLQELRLAGCPLASVPDYRRRVHAAVAAGCLRQLDADDISEKDRDKPDEP